MLWSIISSEGCPILDDSLITSPEDLAILPGLPCLVNRSQNQVILGMCFPFMFSYTQAGGQMVRKEITVRCGKGDITAQAVLEG
jgi:hypothetical protein